MLKLHGNALSTNLKLGNHSLLTVTRTNCSDKARGSYAYLMNGQTPDSGYGCYLDFSGRLNNFSSIDGYLNLPVEMDYLEEGDIISVESSGHTNVVFRRNSPHNTILLTERCNHYCLTP